MLGVDCQIHAKSPLDLAIQREQLRGLFSLICLRRYFDIYIPNSEDPYFLG